MKKLLASALLSVTLPALVRSANVVAEWNTIASTTIVKNGGKASTPSCVWFAYTSIAVYDAVNAITGQYRTFYYQGSAPQGASTEAAAVAAPPPSLLNSLPPPPPPPPPQLQPALLT